ncbi:hypothetical protein M0R45_034714 [Rubus argutus]|uniref:Uncharacterized protein n=1 Tax=Rubus argutus TaxID=59490 RepID=A0AAW1VR20_RUBAR
MSFSDSNRLLMAEPPSTSVFRQSAVTGLLHEMLGSTRTENSKSWKYSSWINIVMFLSDMSGREPFIQESICIFQFTYPKGTCNHIKSDTSVLPRIDSQAFVTDQERALEELFGDVENSRRVETCLNIMATRIATVFASMKELPYVRKKHASYSSWIDLLIRLLLSYMNGHTIAMCHDLLDMDGNKYVHEVPSKTGGDPERKEVLLEDNDPVWLEIRHIHIADASERLSDNAREGNELSTRDLQKMVQALPQYTEQMEKISLHVEIAGKINRIIREMGLRDLGQLEQDLVFGDAGAKDVINFLRTNQDTTPENKLRLLMIYAFVYPEKFEGDKATKLMQLAKLSHEDMKVVNNMRLLGGSSDSKKTTGSFSLKFNNAKTKQAARKDREGEEETWQLFRFFPVLELIENLNKVQLPKKEYSCMNEPGPTPEPGSQRRTQSTSERSSANPHSIRSRRTANWGRARHSDDGYASDSI